MKFGFTIGEHPACKQHNKNASGRKYYAGNPIWVTDQCIWGLSDGKYCTAVYNSMTVDFTTRSQVKLWNYAVQVTSLDCVSLHCGRAGWGSTLLVRQPCIFSAVPTQWPHSGWYYDGVQEEVSTMWHWWWSTQRQKLVWSTQLFHKSWQQPLLWWAALSVIETAKTLQRFFLPKKQRIDPNKNNPSQSFLTSH